MKTCTKCLIEKEESEYHHKHQRLQPLCKTCQTAYFKAWYAKNKGRQIQNVVRWKREHKGPRQNWYAEQKSGPCVDCGVTYPVWVMQFDHVRGTKDGDVGRMFAESASQKVLRAEMDKCDLVCANCHATRTHNRRTAQSTPPVG